MTEIVIDACDLRKEFTVYKKLGRFRRERTVVNAVDGVDLVVERGDMIGYIGPNGAGKSTTLKMLTGILMPTSGHLRVCGVDPVPNRRLLTRDLGVVFGQRSALWWDLPLRESFSLLKHIFAVDGREHTRRLDRCRNLLDLDEFLDTPVRQLSLGQRMRGELTAALLHGPSLLFLDEPTIGLDVVSKQAVRSFLADLSATGDTTIVLTTHDLADIERLCERLVVIDHGRVVHDGSLPELHRRYGSTRTVVVELETPATDSITVDGVRGLVSDVDPYRVSFALPGDEMAPGALVARLAQLLPLKDVSIVEPDIEDVVARLYSGV